MYNSNLEKFSQSFRHKAIASIQREIARVSAMSDDEFFKAMALPIQHDKHSFQQIKDHGTRWNNQSRVLYAMINVLESKLVKHGGLAMMSDNVAKGLEAMFMMPTTGYMFDVLAKDAVKYAAQTDYWYMFEKVWE